MRIGYIDGRKRVIITGSQGSRQHRREEGPLALRSRRSPVMFRLPLLLAAAGLATITLSSSHHASAQARGAAPLGLSSCSPNDITTGGGWIPPVGRAKKTFGFEAGLGPSAPVPGRLVFVDQGANERLVGVIISYLPSAPNSRLMTGSGQVRQETVSFVLQVTDNAGTSGPDMFSLTYVTTRGPGGGAGPLGGGNIQIHRTTCP